MKHFSKCISLIVFFLTVTSALGMGIAGAEPFRIVAYVPNWIDLDSFAKTIDYDHLTHINIAFENPINDRGELSFHPMNESLIRRAHEHKVSVLVSIGGGSASSNKELQDQYRRLLSPDMRARFAASLVEYVKSHSFDGLDVDIEGPSITDDYGPFIEELANAFKSQSKLLTSALSKGYGGSKVPSSALARFDFVNIMAYDGAGSWDPTAPGQHSSMEFTKQNVEYWIDRGLPKSKAVLGVPFYGYGFGAEFRKGTIAYAKILAKYPDAETSDKVGNTIWHNAIPTIKQKTRYAIDQELGGIMIWSLDSDVAGSRSLFKAIIDTYQSR